MDDGYKKLWKAFIQWLEIAHETDERLRIVRQELDEIKRSQQR